MARGGVVQNPGGFTTSLNRAIERFERQWIKRNKILVTQGMKRLIAKTPVYTGQTVRNYVASNGTAFSGGTKDGANPVEPTNRLPLGAERLRSAAAGEAIATLAAVDFSDPYDVFFITNRSPAVAGLEIGELPGPPLSSRSPAGMFGVTLQELTAMLDLGIM